MSQEVLEMIQAVGAQSALHAVLPLKSFSPCSEERGHSPAAECMVLTSDSHQSVLIIFSVFVLERAIHVFTLHLTHTCSLLPGDTCSL